MPRLAGAVFSAMQVCACSARIDEWRRCLHASAAIPVLPEVFVRTLDDALCAPPRQQSPAGDRFQEYQHHRRRRERARSAIEEANKADEAATAGEEAQSLVVVGARRHAIARADRHRWDASPNVPTSRTPLSKAANGLTWRGRRQEKVGRGRSGDRRARGRARRIRKGKGKRKRRGGGEELSRYDRTGRRRELKTSERGRGGQGRHQERSAKRRLLGVDNGFAHIVYRNRPNSGIRPYGMLHARVRGSWVCLTLRAHVATKLAPGTHPHTHTCERAHTDDTNTGQGS